MAKQEGGRTMKQRELTLPEAAMPLLILIHQDIKVLKSVFIWRGTREPPQTTSSLSGDISPC